MIFVCLLEELFGIVSFCMGHLFYLASSDLAAENVGNFCTLRLFLFPNEEKS